LRDFYRYFESFLGFTDNFLRCSKGFCDGVI
jgi:hypothetical protein